MSVAANQLIQAQNPGSRVKAPVAASEHIYQGTLCFWERTSGAGEGYLCDDDDGGANNFAGVAVAEVDNEGGDAGDKNAELFTSGAFVFEGTGFTQAIVGDKAYASDNFTVTGSSSSTTYIGTFKEFISSTKMRVEIDTQLP
jgi:predicted RecA/RadA family phage recombinase